MGILQGVTARIAYWSATADRRLLTAPGMSVKPLLETPALGASLPESWRIDYQPRARHSGICSRLRAEGAVLPVAGVEPGVVVQTAEDPLLQVVHQ